MSANPYASYAVTPDTPSPDGFAVTPSDATPFTTMARRLYVGGAGNVTLITAAGTTLLLTGVLAGSILPIQCSQVKATGTTATLIIGLI
jgi:hypothetical protein